jgi:hypothetical protein
MSNEKKPDTDQRETSTPPSKNRERGSSRRKFLGQVGAALAGGAVFGRSAIAAAQSDNPGLPDLMAPLGSDHSRVEEAKRIRFNCANSEAHIHLPPHTTNGDEQRYHDKSGTYTKGLLQDGIGLVNLAAYQSLRHAIDRGRFQDFENVITGGTRSQNGPLGGIAFSLEGCDGVQLGNAPCPEMQITQAVVPPAPAAASEAYGTELIEMYWGSLLRDVAFTDYSSNSIAAQAAAELTNQPTYAGPRDASGHVTPNLLFRGPYPGDTLGPYVSQLHLIPTFMGVQPISQQMLTYVPNVDYMTDPVTFQQVLNGINTGLQNQADSQFRFLHNGRDLGAYTHLDVLYQAYFVAFLVLNTIHAPPNPGNPYIHSTKQNGFGTFGGPDVAATLTAAARAALNDVWYQKWWVHLRHRPESGGALVRQVLTGHGGTIQAHPHSNVLNSQAVQSSFNRYGDYFLSQAFPEGSPTHPAYPTGHGAVAGACITVLKFFFDNNFVIPNPVVPSNDGLSLQPYTGGDAGQLTVNGELNKLANNISFGHGIHAGIHWRSDTSSSIQFGEAVAISILQDRALAYPEPFTVSLRKIDGTIATISNQ